MQNGERASCCLFPIANSSSLLSLCVSNSFFNNGIFSTNQVGGNSGSPVMNKRGELVAINFDRQRQGLMNEYKWSHAYSRSIGVDVRYILWLIGEYDGAHHLVEELISND